MANLIRTLPYGRISFFGFLSTDHDQVVTPGYEEIVNKEKITGMEGVKRLFMLNEYGHITPQLATATHMSCMCIFGGTLFGGFIHGRDAWVNFMENNQATQFINHMDAKRKLQDIVTQAMGKGAIKWGWKIGAFTTLCIFSNTMISAYRGGPGILEYVLSGALTGSLFKINMGLRGAVAGTIVGGACGTVAGLASSALLWVTGSTMEDIDAMQYKLHVKRDEQVSLARKKHQEDEILKLKNQIAQKAGTLSDSKIV